MKRTIGCFVIFINVLTAASGQNEPALIPYPTSVTAEKGYFTLSAQTRLVVEDRGRFANETAGLQQFIGDFLDQELWHGNREDKNILVVRHSDEELPAGGYRLEVGPNAILISSRHKDGIFYGMQTLKQLLFSAQLAVRQGLQKEIKIPCVTIVDAPAFEWRGLMLDVSRHFFSIEYLKKQIDLLSYFKMNKLHLHLTDDQGWRIEIKSYPELTRQGAWRTFNRQDSSCIASSKFDPDYALDPRFIIDRRDGPPLYGGYYTQDEIKDLVGYAQSRHVEIIPEIDMPGHMSAAIAAYPQLSCAGEAGWGTTFSYPLCPCNEATFVFLERVLEEVIPLFPSRFIHIGMDEVEKATWAGSDDCKSLMKEKGFEQVEQLQAHFADRIQRFLAAKGKEVIAWDEILEGETDPEVNVMFWRDWAGGVPEKTVNNGNRIIFVPTTPLYFSRGDSSLFPIYNIPKLFDAIPQARQSLIRGAQACVWTERTPSENMADKLIYPRLLALAEATWTQKSSHDWSSFKRRLPHQLLYLDSQNVKHPSPPYTLIPLMSVDEKQGHIRIDLESEQIAPVIYYTTDGSAPTGHSQRYRDGIVVTDSARICAAICDKGMMQMPLLERSVDYHKAIGKPVSYQTAWNKAYPANGDRSLTDGLRGGDRYNDGFWQGFTTDIDVTIDLQEAAFVQSFSAMFMQLTGPGVYMPQYVEVSLSDDGSLFHKVLVIPNDVPETERAPTIRKFSGDIMQATRYIKVFAKNSPGRFVFSDEFVIH